MITNASKTLPNQPWRINTNLQRVKTFQERFWEKVDRKSENECWEWMALRDRKGYGKFEQNGVQTAASRISWSMVNGEIPKGMYVCHACDNPPCVNPRHLFIGTPSENIKDMLSKHRQRGPRGEKSGSAKLTNEKVGEVKTLLKSGLSQTEIASRMGVHQSTISMIKNNKIWVA